MKNKHFDIQSDMRDHRNAANWQLEMFLIAISIALAGLLVVVENYQIIILNLFFLPVVLAGFFLGRYRAGVLAFFSVITASVVIWSDIESFAEFQSPVSIALAVTIWGAILGITTIMIGSLSDELSRKMVEAQEAHVGVIEVLSQYLHGVNPKTNHRSTRIAGLSEKVAKSLKLPQHEVDNIRLAALLADVENIEITARVIRKAVGSLDNLGSPNDENTFCGTDLVNSLGEVLSGVVPILLEVEKIESSQEFEELETNIGAEVVRLVRKYDELMNEPWSMATTAEEAIMEIKGEIEECYNPAAVYSLEKLVTAKEAELTEKCDLTLVNA